MTLHTCMIIQTYYPVIGGAERQLQSLVPYLRRAGVQSTVLTRRLSHMDAYQEVEGCPVYRIPAWGRTRDLRSATFTLNALWFLSRHARRFDVLHAHNVLSPTTVAALAGGLYRRPVVTKLLNGGPGGELDRLLHKKLLGGLRWRYFVRHVDAFLCINRELQRELVQAGVAPESAVYLPNGVDVERFAPATRATKQRLRDELGLPGGPLGVFVGRLVQLKNVDLLLRAWPPKASASLVLVGDGPERASLQSQASALGLDRQVHWAGPQQHVERYLCAADFFVLPSRTEGLSNAMLEAMACGLPIVASRVGAAPELLTDPRAGVLVEPNDREGLAQQLNEICRDTSRYQDWGAAGRQVVCDHYSLPHIAAQLAQLYARLLENQP